MPGVAGVQGEVHQSEERIYTSTGSAGQGAAEEPLTLHWIKKQGCSVGSARLSTAEAPRSCQRLGTPPWALRLPPQHFPSPQACWAHKQHPRPHDSRVCLLLILVTSEELQWALSRACSRALGELPALRPWQEGGQPQPVLSQAKQKGSWHWFQAGQGPEHIPLAFTDDISIAQGL